jgi:hypothetical protein
MLSLTLHGTFETPAYASTVFGADHIIDGTHTFLPRLEAFRFLLVGNDDGDTMLFQSVCQFLSARNKLRKEIPARHWLGCCKGVDLGSEEACWVERRDVPSDSAVNIDLLPFGPKNIV